MLNFTSGDKIAQYAEKRTDAAQPPQQSADPFLGS